VSTAAGKDETGLPLFYCASRMPTTCFSYDPVFTGLYRVRWSNLRR